MRRVVIAVIILIIGPVALFLLVIGPIWEQFERQRAFHDFPAPGRVVDIGNRQMQIDCRGAGSPTVVFESGLDITGSLSWAKVHDAVATFTRACAYSRAGIIWSDDKDGSHDGRGVARDLHATLAAAGEDGPFVLVGHSLGGPYITIFTGLFGDEVAGLVFVDASHPDQEKRADAVVGAPRKLPPMATVTKIAAQFSWTGVLRLGNLLLGGAPAPNVPVETARIFKAFAPRSLSPTFSELDALSTTLEQAGAFRDLSARPISVLTHGKQEALPKGMESEAERKKREKIWLDLQSDIASWSSHSTHRILDDAGHYIQFDRPDAVAAAIREVVDDVRAGALTEERTVTPR